MKKLLAAAFAMVVLAGAAVPAAAADRVQVGRLSCEISGGVGFIIGSEKDVSCTFKRKDGKREHYDGVIRKLGIDIGITEETHLEWLVFSAKSASVKKGSLAGTYVGGSAEASLGVGAGANWLIGGSKRGFALQPWSVQGTVGANFTWAFAGLTLY
ncbi:MAG TPA: DUF992 domain-containing protein [Alphaproteobacteria bacterium]|nr:DUF992 domain-containing protein [Alphaproteobacteria bacterium]